VPADAALYCGYVSPTPPRCSCGDRGRGHRHFVRSRVIVYVSEPRSLPLADRAGVGAAVGCATHCLLTPWLVSMLPIVAPIVETERTETIFLCASLTVSAATLMAARLRVHTCWIPVGIFAIAALVLVAVRALGVVDQPLGRVVVVSAACLIAAAHCANIRCCRNIVRVTCYRDPLAGESANPHMPEKQLRQSRLSVGSPRCGGRA
jgi:hypothetical protein